MAEAFLENVYTSIYDQYYDNNYISIWQQAYNYTNTGIFNDVTEIKTSKVFEVSTSYNGMYYLNNLKYVEMPNARIIDKYAFSTAFNLEKASFEKVFLLRERAFEGCDNLSYLYIPNLKFAGSYVFSNCSNLKNIDGINNLILADKWLFYHCYGLSSIIINNLEYMSTSVFAHCDNLVNAEFPNLRFLCDAPGEGYYLFQFESCSKLKTLDLGKVEILKPNIASYSNTNYFPYANNCDFAITYHDNLEILKMSKLIELRNVSYMLGNITYNNSSNYFSYNMDDLTIIENCYSVFWYRLVSSIRFPKLKFINKCEMLVYNYYANSYCNIREIYCPELLYINNTSRLFIQPDYRSTRLPLEVFNMNKLRKIINCSYIFSGISFPSVISFPMLEEISGGQCTFSVGCHLETVIAPRLKKIDAYSTFYYISYLRWIDMPNLELIGSYTFCMTGLLGDVRQNKNITDTYELYLPKCKSIYNHAFYNCPLEFVELPNAEYISNNAFNGCWDLKYINIGNCSVLSEIVFYNCGELAYIKADNIKEIKDGAFQQCVRLGATLCTCDEDGKPDLIEYSGQSIVYVLSPKISSYISYIDSYIIYRNSGPAFYSDDEHWYTPTMPYSRLSYNPQYWYKDNGNYVIHFPECVSFIDPFSATYNSYIRGISLPKCQKFSMTYLGTLSNLLTIDLPSISNISDFHVSCSSIISAHLNNLILNGISDSLSNFEIISGINSSTYSLLTIDNLYLQNVESFDGRNYFSTYVFGQCKNIYLNNLSSVYLYYYAWYGSKDHCMFLNLNETEYINLEKLTLSSTDVYKPFGFIGCYNLKSINLNSLSCLEYGRICFTECSSLSMLSLPNLLGIGVWHDTEYRSDLCYRQSISNIVYCIFPNNLISLYLMGSQVVSLSRYNISSSYIVNYVYNFESFPIIDNAYNNRLYWTSTQTLIASSYYSYTSGGRTYYSDLYEFKIFGEYVENDGHSKQYITLFDETFNNPHPLSDQTEYRYKRYSVSAIAISQYVNSLKYAWLFSKPRSSNPLDVIVPGSLYHSYLSNYVWKDLIENYHYINLIGGG